MPSVLDRLAPGTARRKNSTRGKAAGTRRGQRTAKGATRKRTQREAAPRAPAVWLNRLLILGAVLIVGAAGTQAYLHLKSLPVQHITVTGELEHTQAAAVQELVQMTLTGGFLSADLKLMRRELENLPWVYEASVRRRWPQTLEIHVQEQLPIARWGEDSFLNHEGVVFSSDKDGDWAALPQLRGPKGSAPALMAKYQRLLEMLAPLGLEVRQLAVDERGQVDAVLKGGMQLVIGGEQFRERMTRFAAVYRSELKPQSDQIERVDLRYATGLAVAYREKEPSQVAGLYTGNE